jgi:hypothetical protein
MFWVEIDFVNGKTVKREYENLNDAYAVVNRYSTKSRIARITDAVQIRTGRDNVQTGCWKPGKGLVACINQ